MKILEATIKSKCWDEVPDDWFSCFKSYNGKFKIILFDGNFYGRYGLIIEKKNEEFAPKRFNFKRYKSYKYAVLGESVIKMFNIVKESNIIEVLNIE